MIRFRLSTILILSFLNKFTNMRDNLFFGIFDSIMILIDNLGFTISFQYRFITLAFFKQNLLLFLIFLENEVITQNSWFIIRICELRFVLLLLLRIFNFLWAHFLNCSLWLLSFFVLTLIFLFQFIDFLEDLRLILQRTFISSTWMRAHGRSWGNSLLR